MQRMNDSQGFARLNQTNSNDNFIVMTLLGRSLSDILGDKGMSLFDVKRIAYQLIIRMQ